MKFQVAALIFLTSAKHAVGDTGSSSYPHHGGSGGAYYNYGYPQDQQRQQTQHQSYQGYGQQHQQQHHSQYHPSHQNYSQKQQIQPVARQESYGATVQATSKVADREQYQQYQQDDYSRNQVKSEIVEDVLQQEEEELPPLPEGWMEYIDPNSGRPYYYNSKTGETTWDRPIILLSEQNNEERDEEVKDQATEEDDGLVSEPTNDQITLEEVDQSQPEVEQPLENKSRYNYDYSDHSEESLQGSEPSRYDESQYRYSESSRVEEAVKHGSQKSQDGGYDKNFSDYQKYDHYPQQQSHAWGMPQSKVSGWGSASYSQYPPSSEQRNSETSSASRGALDKFSSSPNKVDHTNEDKNKPSFSMMEPQNRYVQQSQSQPNPRYPLSDPRNAPKQYGGASSAQEHYQGQEPHLMKTQGPSSQQQRLAPQQQPSWGPGGNKMHFPDQSGRSYQPTSQQWGEQLQDPHSRSSEEEKKEEQEQPQGIFSSLFGRKKDIEVSKVENSVPEKVVTPPASTGMKLPVPLGVPSDSGQRGPRPIAQYPPSFGQMQQGPGQYRPGPGSFGDAYSHSQPFPPSSGQLQRYQAPPVDNISSVKSAIGGFFQKALTSVDQVKNSALQRAQEVSDTVATQGSGILGRARAQVENLQKNFFDGDQGGDYSISPYGSTPQGQQYPPQNYGGYPSYGPPQPRSTQPYPHQGPPHQQYPPHHGDVRGSPPQQQRPPLQSQWHGQSFHDQQKQPLQQDGSRSAYPQHQTTPSQNQWLGRQNGAIPPQHDQQQYRPPSGQYPPRGGQHAQRPQGQEVATAVDPWQHPELSGF